jgi:hypothetical protein
MSAMSSLVHRQSVRQLGLRVVVARSYHDESFGFRKPRAFTLPDCELTLVLNAFAMDFPFYWRGGLCRMTVLTIDPYLHRFPYTAT